MREIKMYKPLLYALGFNIYPKNQNLLNLDIFVLQLIYLNPKNRLIFVTKVVSSSIHSSFTAS